MPGRPEPKQTQERHRKLEQAQELGLSQKWVQVLVSTQTWAPPELA